VLALNRFWPTALADFLLLITYLRNHVGQKTHVGFEARRRRIHARFEDAGSRGRTEFVSVGHEGNSQEPLTV